MFQEIIHKNICLPMEFQLSKFSIDQLKAERPEHIEI